MSALNRPPGKRADRCRKSTVRAGDVSPNGGRFGSISAAELRARRRRVLLSKRTPKSRLSEEFRVDRQKRPRRKPAGALFRRDRHLSIPLFSGFRSSVKLRPWPRSLSRSLSLTPAHAGWLFQLVRKEPGPVATDRARRLSRFRVDQSTAPWRTSPNA